ncbi:MAG: phosphatidate cytidylyltransferase [Bacilli bacterium]|nr:phosphatidate cytidylyltransferase [Bacilli bacterium]MBQ6282102.1 phosphatidate cytidylyltransferase [Bacilli bacterium]
MKERVISAIIALIIIVPFVLLGGVYFNVSVAILGTIGLWELLRIKENIPSIIKIIAYVLFLMLLVYGYTFTGKIYLMNFTFVVISFIILFSSLLVYNDRKKYSVEDVFYILAAIIFLSAAFNLFIVIRSKSLMLLVYLLLITTMTDTFAYTIGSKIGKHKLLPNVSPKKSVEGFVAGLIGGTLIATVFYIFCIDSSSIMLTIAITLVLSVIGQMGDLIFSSMKRHFNIKDFSNIMPGHGGILDRLDSIIFVLFGYIIFTIFL